MKTQEKIIGILNAGTMMARGTISSHGLSKSGKRAHVLQYHRKAKHFSRNIAHDELALFETATANCREFLELVQKYIDEQTTRTIRKIEKEVERERGKSENAKRKND